VVRVASDEPTSGEVGGSTNPCDSDDPAVPEEEEAAPPTDDGGVPEGDAGLPTDDGTDEADSDDDGGLLPDLPIL
jgi:hypothetical protein